ncbi:glycosyltransferase family 4 protein [Mogibacterium kristiansenii]|uniref:Glycosyltransferase family 4 protein n=1 Tax=Mogibacterium kristiansenii TaxID=2606708 RepID=A0A6N7X9F7_9FIRM|nr:glycosyltransferase [Mogibacterium kristiansenii]MST71163.1 glycosyltransferase family 4 protein [Mogibacterium kristiansenii]
MGNKLLVACDVHLLKAPDGSYWCDAIYKYNFWKRYMDVFQSIRVAGRCKEVKTINPKWHRVDGPRVEIFEIPFYQGPKQLLFKYMQIQKCLKNVDEGCDAALMRMPSQTAYMVFKHLSKKIPKAGEIVYDPSDDVKRKGQSFIMRILNRRISNQLKQFCRTVNGVSYVTEYSIQKNYPSVAAVKGESKEYFESNYSTITLSNDAFTSSRNYNNISHMKIALSSVAMESDRKGEKILIRAVKIARQKGFDITAVIIGDGSKRGEFEKYAKAEGVDEFITFTGLLPSSDEVREQLLKSDIYMFPTQAEGLPRGILEAMAVGMPVLSTPVGGIPEIIEKDYLFSPFDAEAFANKICYLMENPDELNIMSKKNFEKSKSFANTVLQKKRNEFYIKLCKLI